MIHSRYYCPRCIDDSKSYFILSPLGVAEYEKSQSTDRYYCTKCRMFYKIIEGFKEID